MNLQSNVDADHLNVQIAKDAGYQLTAQSYGGQGACVFEQLRYPFSLLTRYR
jgi:hypothetical protein